MRLAVMNLVFLQLFLSSIASSNEFVNVYRQGDGVITLTGENCDFIKRHTLALSIWKTNLNEIPKKLNSTCSCDSFRCYMDINEVLPDFVEHYQDVSAGRWGPNCWNTVLVASEILPVTRFSPPEEMSFWMSSPLCKAVPESEMPQPGDIVAVRDSKKDEVHASIYITDELFFSKNAVMTSASYQLQSSIGIFAIFPVPFACRHRFGNPTDCSTYVNYYRCSSFADYSRNQNIILTDRYKELETLILQQEQMVSKIIFEWKTNPDLQHASPEILRVIQAKMNSIRTEVINHANDITASPDQQLIWNGLKFRISGILLSIDWIS